MFIIIEIRIKMKQTIFSITIISLILSFVSCSKVGDKPPTPQQVDSIKIFGVDSSELVKSVTSMWTDSLGNVQDSSTTYIYYDTIDRKIFMAPTLITAPNPANYSNIFSYNTSYQLSNLKINPASVDTGDAVSIDYAYDNQHIISSETQTHKDNVQEVRNIQKTSLSGNSYSLSSEDADVSFDTSITSFTFNSNGQLNYWSITELPDTSPWFSDSLVYDAAGNVSAVIENDASNTSQVNAFEMMSRSTKGNELSILNKILFNGISQLPDVTGGNFDGGDQFNGYNNFFFYQVTAYPAATAKVYQQFSSSYVTFNTGAQFDSNNRLILYKLYNGDEPFYYEIERLAYYK